MIMASARHNTAQQSYAAEGLNVHELYWLVSEGQGERALREVAEEARLRGGWGPAPRDTIAYDPGMATNIRAQVLAVDRPPAECADPRLKRLTDGCDRDFQTRQNLVRFGATMFSTPEDDGARVTRAAPDDLLSTFIEEVGHSWQEYLFETNGLQHGVQMRQTTWEDGLYWRHGWEYQAKAYVLSLDGSLLTLSGEETTRLRRDICDPNGYAHPIGNNVAPYGPPPGWPNPSGWPTAAPSAEALASFCAGN